jgi:hypothetical protein
LVVTGTTNLAGAMTASALTVSGALGVTGLSALNTLAVTGTAVFLTGATANALDVTGNVNAASFNTTSDRRLKKDFEEVQDALSKVAALHPVYYNWTNRNTMNPDVKEIGFIAQEVEEVLPAVVTTDADEMNTKRVAYDRVVSLLVAAMKEQSAVIAALEARLAALESK